MEKKNTTSKEAMPINKVFKVKCMESCIGQPEICNTVSQKNAWKDILRLKGKKE